MKTSFLILFSILSLPSFSQNKIGGFGNYKIDKLTIDSMFTWEPLVKSVPAEYFLSEQWKRGLYEILPILEYSEDNIHISAYSSYCPKARMFYLNETNIGGIACKEVYLTFLNDTLIEVRIDRLYLEDNEWAELEPLSKFLRSKYGKGVDKFEYSSNLRINRKVSESWASGSLSMKCGDITYFNYNTGKPEIVAESWGVYVRDNTKMNSLIKCSEQAKIKLKSDYDKMIKNKYSKF